MNLADLRDKIIVSMLGLGGFRVGTLVRLQYRHVKRDLEKMAIPIHVHVEAEPGHDDGLSAASGARHGRKPGQRQSARAQCYI